MPHYTGEPFYWADQRRTLFAQGAEMGYMGGWYIRHNSTAPDCPSVTAGSSIHNVPLVGVMDLLCF